MTRSVGLIVIIAGLALAALGLLIYTGALSWFGRLPGDIRFEGENTKVYIPITSMLVLSAVLTLGYHVLRKFF